MSLALREARRRNPETLTVWMPGQYTDNLDSQTLVTCAALSDVIIGNSHEIGHIRNIAPQGLTNRVSIETNGPRPVRALLPDGSQRTLPVPPAKRGPHRVRRCLRGGHPARLLIALDKAGKGDWYKNINGIIRAGNRQAAHCLPDKVRKPTNWVPIYGR